MLAAGAMIAVEASHRCQTSSESLLVVVGVGRAVVAGRVVVAAKQRRWVGRLAVVEADRGGSVAAVDALW